MNFNPSSLSLLGSISSVTLFFSLVTVELLDATNNIAGSNRIAAIKVVDIIAVYSAYWTACLDTLSISCRCSKVRGGGD